MIRNELAQKYKRISVFAASISFAILGMAYDSVNAEINSNSKLSMLFDEILGLLGLDAFFSVIVLAIFGTSIFLISFKLCLSLYYRVIWRLFCSCGYVGGKWYLFYDVYNNDCNGELGEDRFERQSLIGKADILHNMEGVVINARSFDPNIETLSSGVKSLWTTSSSTLFYELVNGSMNLSNQKGNSVGNMSLHIIPNESASLSFERLLFRFDFKCIFIDFPKKCVFNFIILVAKVVSFPVIILRKFGYISPARPSKITGHYSFVQGSSLTQGRLTLIRKGTDKSLDSAVLSADDRLRAERNSRFEDWKSKPKE
ncbi:hypothetical protein [Vibrio rotiferianus]|uniref:hypothetical protein n=1 Tax=Vibrio rotiferianus TaxID=190895 RepID=UPI00390AA088